MKTKLLITGLVSLFLAACTKDPIITDVKLVKLDLPVITHCQRLSITDCKPRTNGELYECALEITKKLSLCADQTDALINWQKVKE